MMRGVFSFVLVFHTLIVFGQDSGIPSSIAVPQGSWLIAHTYARGVQVYVCTPDAKDSSHYTWTLKEPRAKLYADGRYHKTVGKHYFDASKNPTWEATDGSKVRGVKVQQANSPDSTAIPWLLLKSTATQGSGKFTPVLYIQRLHTKGGKAPAIADRAKKRQSIEVAYTAEYLFYGKK
jgi:hypothetical protein